MNSADQIDQLNDLRLKIQKANKNLSGGKGGKFRKTKYRVWGKKFSKKKLTENMATSRGKLKLVLLGNMGIFRGSLFPMYGGSLKAGRFLYAVEIKPTSADPAKTGEYVGENRKLDDMFCVNGFQEFADAGNLRRRYSYRALW